LKIGASSEQLIKRQSAPYAFMGMTGISAATCNTGSFI